MVGLRGLRRAAGVPRRPRPASRSSSTRRTRGRGWPTRSGRGSPRVVASLCPDSGLPGERSSGCRCAARSPGSTGWRCARRPATSSACPARPDAAGVRRLAGCPHAERRRRRRTAQPAAGRDRGAARPRARNGTAAPPGAAATWPRPTSSAWTWRTPPPTPRSCRAGAHDDRRRGHRRRPARRLRPAPARQRRAGAQRRARRRRGRGCSWTTPSSPANAVAAELVPLLTDPPRLAAMSRAARSSGHADAADGWRTWCSASPVPTVRRRAGSLARQHPGPGGPRAMGTDVTTWHGVRPSSSGRVHLIGIGGAGMSGIARILLARGVAVSGFGRQGLPRRARAARARRPGRGRPRSRRTCPRRPPPWWSRSAIRADQPGAGRAARERGLAVVHRAAALAALMAGRRLAAVAGTAGKTSTTSMLTVALQHCGLDPSFAIGGDLAASGSGAHDGSGDIFVAEADESDGVVPRVLPGGRGGHQRRGRPPRPLRRAPRPTARRSSVPRPDRARRRRSSPAPTTPGPRRWPGSAERRGIRVRRYGRAAGPRRPAGGLPAGRHRRADRASPRRRRAPSPAGRARGAHGAERPRRAARRRGARRPRRRSAGRARRVRRRSPPVRVHAAG